MGRLQLPNKVSLVSKMPERSYTIAAKVLGNAHYDNLSFENRVLVEGMFGEPQRVNYPIVMSTRTVVATCPDNEGVLMLLNRAFDRYRYLAQGVVGILDGMLVFGVDDFDFMRLFSNSLTISTQGGIIVPGVIYEVHIPLRRIANDIKKEGNLPIKQRAEQLHYSPRVINLDSGQALSLVPMRGVYEYMGASKKTTEQRAELMAEVDQFLMNHWRNIEA